VDEEAAARRAAATARGVLGDMAFFDFNRADLTPADKATLDQKIPILNANPDVRLRIAGNCDDRGSDEYNLVLGERRASTAKRYLAAYGIEASRLEVISYGRERPIAEGDNEAAWAKNRNDQFEIVAGGGHLRGVVQ
jgi:peptidoglycan-associated lipoprotein